MEEFDNWVIMRKICLLVITVYVLAAFCVANSFQTEVLKCDGQPAAQDVQITGCSSLPCSFKRGSHVQADISFVVSK